MIYTSTSKLKEQMSQKRTFGKYLQKFPDEIRKIALKLRVLILKVIPRASETVHPGMKWIVYGVPRSIIAIKPGQKHVNLFFFEGIQLRDPNHILRGSGTRLRYIPVVEVEKKKKIINEFIEQAYFIHVKKKI